MRILGFNCFAHDAAAAIVVDGELLGLVEEERFLREKHTGEFPRHAIRWCCDLAGIAPSELDEIVYYWDPSIGFWPRVGHVLKYFPRSLELVRSRWGRVAPMQGLRRRLRREFGVTDRTRLHFAPHHLCHAASAFLTSSCHEAAILTIDAAGEWDCSWLGVGRGLDLECRKSMQFPNSIGLFYGALTEYLGFRFASGEGKVMGLAPYGDPETYIGAFREILAERPAGGYELDLSYFAYHYRGRPNWFSRKFFDRFGPPRDFADGEISQRHMDIAAAAQLRTEEIGIHMARWLREETSLDTLCLAGGVCLNSVMNGRILLESGFKEVLIQPAANDAGTALGACYWLWNSVMREPRTFTFDHAYLGPWWEPDEIERSIEASLSPDDRDKVEVRTIEDAPAVAARLIAEQKIIGWFQGRMEMGPRALGNRSILADPRSLEMKDLLNERVKFRESFRPFAPSVLEERTDEWFEGGHLSPYMILVFDVKPERRAEVPAITHVDGTGRLHTVSMEQNPRYYRLIERFEEQTGIPIVLNTSFNIRGKPIVHTVEDAIECFLTTGIDALFLGDTLLSKKTDCAADDLSADNLRKAHESALAADNRAE